MTQSPSEDGLVLALKDDLCLDFANTLFWRGTATPKERFHEWSDVLAWLEQAGLGMPHLPAREAEAALREAIALREVVYAVFAALAAGRQPREEELRELNRGLAAAQPRRELRETAAGYGWVVKGEAAGAAAILAPVLWSAGDLLAGRRLDRVRRCANDACLWLFLDDSKSGNRRWCAMSACGNRAKAHRHYIRQKES